MLFSQLDIHKMCPFLWGHLHSHPTHGSLDPPDSASQTAYRSIQPFLDILRQKTTIFCNGLPLLPSKLPLRREIGSVAERILTRAQMGDRLATIDMGRKVGGCCTPFRGRTGSPSNTMLPGRRPASVPSGILIHPIVSPQYINVTDRTDRQDNGPVA